MNRRTRFSPGSDAHREDVRGIFIALLINGFFLGLAALVFWLLGHASLGLTLAQGYGVFWLLLIVSILLLVLVDRLTGFNADDHFNTYVSVNLVVNVVLVAGWAAFAALTMGAAATGEAIIKAGGLYVVGFLSCYIAFAVTSAFYMGSIYKVVDLAVVLIGFIVFALWPALGRVLYGWFFAFFV